MNISSAFVAYLQSPEAIQPGQGPFHYPTMSTEFFTALNSSPCDPRKDVAPTQEPSVFETVVAFVCMQFVRTLAWASTFLANSRDGLHHFFQQGRVVQIGSRMPDHQRDALSFDHKMALRARFSRVPACGCRRVRPGFFAPPGAGTLPASREARDQSSCSASASRSSKTRCNLSHTPAVCQSRSRLQHVIPLPQPISGGSISHGMPVLSTNKIPLNTARFEISGRPPFGLGFSEGKSGSITCHSSSLTSCLAIPQSYQSLGFC